jgi:hypothetical protein
VSAADVVGKLQEPTLVHARAICAWVLRQRPLSDPEIGRVLRRDRATVWHARNKVDAERTRNPRVAAALERMLRLDGEREEPQHDGVREAAVQGADPGEGCGEVGHGGDNVPRR